MILTLVEAICGGGSQYYFYKEPDSIVRRIGKFLVHGKEDYVARKTLGELADLLGEDKRFCRVGRSAIVNLSCIGKVTKREICLNDGSTVPLPRGAYEKVNRAIINME